jgi:hypothetical protein
MKIYATGNSDFIYLLGAKREYCIFNKQGMSFAGVKVGEEYWWGKDEEGRERTISIDEARGEIDIVWGDIRDGGKIIINREQEEKCYKFDDGSTLLTAYQDVILLDDGKGNVWAGRMWFHDDFYLMEDGGRLYRDETSYRVEYNSNHGAKVVSVSAA